MESGSRKKSARLQFLCTECGDSFGQWFGRCPVLPGLGQLKEFRPPTERAEERPRPALRSASPPPPGATAEVQRLGEIPLDTAPAARHAESGSSTGFSAAAWSAGSVVLLGGDPGIGKSTLLLQVGGVLSSGGVRVLYVSGEESAGQVRLRSERLHGVSRDLLFLPETDLEAVAAAVEQIQPAGSSSSTRSRPPTFPRSDRRPGSLAQVRESALALLSLAKSRGMAAPGRPRHQGRDARRAEDARAHGRRRSLHGGGALPALPGPPLRQEPLRQRARDRRLRDGRRRAARGPQSEPALPRREHRRRGRFGGGGQPGGNARACSWRCRRSCTRPATARRSASPPATTRRRLAILLAVLAKRGGVDTSQHDVFVNVAGGLRVEEPGVDLGVLLAVASSCPNGRPARSGCVGEVGLGGEVRRVAHPERRLAEAARLGYRRVMLPEANVKDMDGRQADLTLVGVFAVAEVLEKGLQPDERWSGAPPAERWEDR